MGKIRRKTLGGHVVIYSLAPRRLPLEVRSSVVNTNRLAAPEAPPMDVNPPAPQPVPSGESAPRRTLTTAVVDVGLTVPWACETG